VPVPSVVDWPPADTPTVGTGEAALPRCAARPRPGPATQDRAHGQTEPLPSAIRSASRASRRRRRRWPRPARLRPKASHRPRWPTAAPARIQECAGAATDKGRSPCGHLQRGEPRSPPRTALRVWKVAPRGKTGQGGKKYLLLLSERSRFISRPPNAVWSNLLFGNDPIRCNGDNDLAGAKTHTGLSNLLFNRGFSPRAAFRKHRNQRCRPNDPHIFPPSIAERDGEVGGWSAPASARARRIAWTNPRFVIGSAPIP
jgi:hypothetical protein